MPKGSRWSNGVWSTVIDDNTRVRQRLPRKTVEADQPYLFEFISSLAEHASTAASLPDLSVSDHFRARTQQDRYRYRDAYLDSLAESAGISRGQLDWVANQGVGLEVTAVWRLGEWAGANGNSASSGLLAMASLPSFRGHVLEVAKKLLKQILALPLECLRTDIPGRTDWKIRMWPPLAFILLHTDVTAESDAILLSENAYGFSVYESSAWIEARKIWRLESRDDLRGLNDPKMKYMIDDAWAAHCKDEMTEANYSSDRDVSEADAFCNAFLRSLSGAVLRERIGSPVEDRALAQEHVEALVAKIDALIERDW